MSELQNVQRAPGDVIDDAAVHRNDPKFLTNFVNWDGPTWLSVSTIQVSAGSFRDDSDSALIVLDSNTVADITVTGAGGLQTGSSESADTWYGVYVIDDTTGLNSPNVLLIPEGTGFSETGYDVARLVSWGRNNASSDFYKFFAAGKGREIEYEWDIAGTTSRVLNNGSATSFTDVDCSEFIPPSSKKAKLSLGFDPANSGNVLRLRTNGAVTDAIANQFSPPVSSGNSLRVQAEILTDSGQLIEYHVTTGSDIANLFVLGFTDII